MNTVDAVPTEAVCWEIPWIRPVACGAVPLPVRNDVASSMSFASISKLVIWERSAPQETSSSMLNGTNPCTRVVRTVGWTNAASPVPTSVPSDALVTVTPALVTPSHSLPMIVSTRAR